MNTTTPRSAAEAGGAATEPCTPLRVAFIHPDLGIGGAERLVVDAAVGLQNSGHKVVMYTSHHDPSHCFEETRDGIVLTQSLQASVHIQLQCTNLLDQPALTTPVLPTMLLGTLNVHVGGNTIVPRMILGRFYIICAIFRNLHLALIMWWLNRRAAANEKFDIIISDQLSVSIPLLRWTGAKVFFYCHFPDKLLTKRESLLKKIYRLPVDLVEELTTGMADTIVVNSKFTANVFKESFKMLHQTPEVLYPSIQFDKFDRAVDLSCPEVQVLTATEKITFLSINRYERKKDINLAIHAFARLVNDGDIQHDTKQSLRLVVAGGYDTRVTENVEHHQELVQLAEKKHGLKTWTLASGQTDKPVPKDTQVLFLQSISDVQKLFLLQFAHALLYTPTNEHFGIVPVEAMYMKCPVIAVNSGGPTESILHGVTGYLCPADEEVWANTLKSVLEKSDSERRAMGQAGHERVVGLFSLPAFVSKLNGILLQLHQGSSKSHGIMKQAFILSVAIAVFSVVLYYHGQ